MTRENMSTEMNEGVKICCKEDTTQLSTVVVLFVEHRKCIAETKVCIEEYLYIR